MGLDQFSLTGRAAIVTGAGRGIGRAIARALSEAGAGVVVCDIDGVSAEAGAAEIRSAGGVALSARVDVTQENSVADLVEQAARWGGRLDVLVNNAGVTVQRRTEELSLEEWNSVLAVNLTGAFLCSKHAARVMSRGDGGSIVNIASIHAQVAPAFHRAAAYAAAKAGLLGLTRALAVEWAPNGIRVNAICPTYVRTEMTRKQLEDPDYLARIVERTPLGRVADPSDIVGSVLYLASAASGMVTGHTLNVDGGWLSV